MSSVTTTLLQAPLVVPPTRTAPFHTTTFTQTCHKCGADLSNGHPVAVAEQAQRRIAELESQVKILTGKASAAGIVISLCLASIARPARHYSSPDNLFGEIQILIHEIVDKLADYEDELRRLRPSAEPSEPSVATKTPSRPNSAAGLQLNHLQSRIYDLLPSNRRTISQPPSSAPPDQTTHFPDTARENADLLNLLAREQSLRQAAETRVSQTNGELEELSAQLFTEANEMVATERKARAKLEERVAIFEKRDEEKRTWLGVLEARLGRIERVREILK